MSSLAELEQMRAALVVARSNGIREVRDENGESITYKSDSEMRAALASITAEIRAVVRGRNRPAVFRVQTSKGL